MSKKTIRVLISIAQIILCLISTLLVFDVAVECAKFPTNYKELSGIDIIFGASSVNRSYVDFSIVNLIIFIISIIALLSVILKLSLKKLYNNKTFVLLVAICVEILGILYFFTVFFVNSKTSLDYFTLSTGPVWQGILLIIVGISLEIEYFLFLRAKKEVTKGTKKIK